MIEAKLKEVPIEPKHVSYPLIMQSLVGGTVVLFNSLNAGTVIVQGDNNNYPIGYYGADWCDVDDTAIWRRLDASESVTLNNT